MGKTNVQLGENGFNWQNGWSQLKLKNTRFMIWKVMSSIS
jgi:hypothetical protein